MSPHRIAGLRAMAADKSSPNEAKIARRMLADAGIPLEPPRPSAPPRPSPRPQPMYGYGWTTTTSTNSGSWSGYSIRVEFHRG